MFFYAQKRCIVGYLNFLSKNYLVNKCNEHQRVEEKPHPPSLEPKEELDKGKGKGRRCCLGNRNYSIPCRASYCALGKFKKKDELHQYDLKKTMNSSYF